MPTKKVTKNKEPLNLNLAETSEVKSLSSTDIRALKRGTHLTFNALRMLKKDALTFCLHKVLIKCRVSIRKSSIWFYIDSAVQSMKYYGKSIHFTSFSK